MPGNFFFIKKGIFKNCICKLKLTIPTQKLHLHKYAGVATIKRYLIVLPACLCSCMVLAGEAILFDHFYYNTKNSKQNEKANQKTQPEQKNDFKSYYCGNGKKHRRRWADKRPYMCFHLW